MKKSTKSKTPAAPQVKKTAASTKKKAVGTTQAVTKAAAAPAKKKPAAKKAAAPVPAAPAPKKAAVKKTAAPKAAVNKPVTAKKAAPKKATQKAAAKTVITAKINIGFGNTLFLRGEGPDLSWDVGAPMNCAGDDEWTIAIAGAKAPVVAKFLVNDITWSTGEDFVIEAGSSVVLEPSF